MPATATVRTAAADAADQPVLRIDALGVRFGRHEVLRDISLDLAAGERVVASGREIARDTGASPCAAST